MKITYFKEIDSTNTYLKNLEEKENWETAAAETQTAGRGRREKKWFSGYGGAWFSTAIKEDRNMTQEEWLKIPIVVCYAVLNYLEKKTSLQLKYKWTNDIYCNGKKLAGILVEKSGEFFIVGVGINVNNIDFGDFAETATSIKKETEKTYEIKLLIESIVEEISQAYFMLLRGDWKLILNYLEERDFLKGRKISVEKEENNLEGYGFGISEQGFLLLKTNNEILEINTGDVLWK